ncbi:MAG TPA: phosphatase PAP2 family protein [Chloroflexota bacterium]|nr:phosphatase PAP2 family protein [Chloroflexota bacterium]
MPSDLTIFAAKYLVFVDAVIAVALCLWLVTQRPRPAVVRWVIAVVIMLVLSLVFSRIGAALISDPRPFTQDHVKPLISHAADNGFPSDHALLAAAIVAAVLLIAPMWSIPFIVLGFLVDWARIGAGIHHVEDVVGSSVIVAIALLIALAVATPIADRLRPYLPAAWGSDAEAAGTTARPASP